MDSSHGLRRKRSASAVAFVAAHLDPAAQELGNAPGLSDTPPRGERRLGIEDLADRPDAGLVEMRDKALERLSHAGYVVWINLQPGVHIRSGQPAPDGALVVRRVARAQISVVARFEVRIVGRKRPESDRRQQFALNRADDFFPPGALEYRVVQRNRQQLIGPAFRVVTALLRVDDVVEVFAGCVPEALVE